MRDVMDFIRWALTHVNKLSVPSGAVLANGTAKNVGKEPWHYLYGTVKAKTTADRIKERWNNYYSKSWNKEQYDAVTSEFKSNEYATDCQGLLDAYLTYERGEKTDINADFNYKAYCTDKGDVDSLADRPFVIGEAVFMKSKKTGRMNHIGFVCGFDSDGSALVVEARGLAYGVVVTNIEERDWTHRGLMTKFFDYSDNENEHEENMNMIHFELTSPLMHGDNILLMQKALNANGYTDSNGNVLTEDGKCGSKTLQAITMFAAEHMPETDKNTVLSVFASNNGYNLPYLLKTLKSKNRGIYGRHDHMSDSWWIEFCFQHCVFPFVIQQYKEQNCSKKR